MSSAKLNASLKAIWVIVLVVAVGMTAFGSGFIAGQKSGKQAATTVIDDYGRTIKIGETPKRVVSTAPTPTEILFAVGAGGLVVGVDDYSDYPAATKNITKVGSFELNVEVILGLKPDLIISSDLVPLAQLQQLEDRGVPYVILAARTIQDVFNDIKLVGLITNRIDAANDLVSSLQERVDTVSAKTADVNLSRPSVYLEFYPLWTYGPGSFGDDLITLAGGVNIASNLSQEYVPVTDEFVIAQDPQVIIYTVGTNFNGTTPETITERPGWSSITAVSGNAIYSIDDNIVSRYGPRIVDGLEAIAHMLHPELF